MKISEIIYELSKIQHNSGVDLDVSIEDGYLVVHEPSKAFYDSNGDQVKTWTLEIVSPVTPLPAR